MTQDIEEIVGSALQAVIDRTREDIKAAFSGRRYRARLSRAALSEPQP